MPVFTDLDDRDRRAFIAEVIAPSDAKTKKRRQDFALRRRMLSGDFETDVRDFIKLNRYKNKGIAAEVAGFVTNIHNPMKRLASRVAVVYKHPAIRTLPKAKKTDQDNYAALNQEIRLNRRMKTINQEAWAMNTVIVVPVPYERDGEKMMRIRAFAGDNCEVLRNEDDPFGLPDVLGYVSGEHPSNKGKLVTTLDSQAWRTWDDAGRPFGEPVEHNLGFFPASMVRMADPPEAEDADYWGPESGAGLRDCALEVGYIAATKGWVRKAQNRLLMVLLAEGEENQADGQVHHPEAGMRVFANDDQVSLLIENFDQPITNFQAHIKSLQDETAEVHAGVPSTLADPDERVGVGSNEQIEEHAALTEVRENQIEEFSLFEPDFARKLHAVAGWYGHSKAVSPDEISKRFQVTFPQLQSLDSRKDRLEVAIKGAEFGVDDQVRYVMAEHGFATEDAATEFIMEMAERRAKLDEFRASRQQKADPTGDQDALEEDPQKPGEPLSASQGRRGGRAPSPMAGKSAA